MPDTFSHDEVRALARAWRETVKADRASHLDCPRCGTRLDHRSILPRRDVSYVRDRVWLVCPACHRSTVVDRREGP